jgi:hypothetical protein
MPEPSHPAAAPKAAPAELLTVSPPPALFTGERPPRPTPPPEERAPSQPSAPRVEASPPPPPSAEPPRTLEAVPPPPPAPPLVAEQVADGLVRHARIAEREGATEFTIELHPKELGKVRVQLSSTPEGLTGRLLVGDESARQTVASQLHVLEQRLGGASLTVARDSPAGSGGQGRQDRQQPWRPPAPEGHGPRAARPFQAGAEDQGLDVVA